MNRMTARTVYLLIALSLSATACASPAAPAADSAPAAVSTPAAVAPVVEPAPDATATASASTESAGASASTRVFAIDPTRSEASYQVEEEFFGQNIAFVTAIGKTQTIQSQLALKINGTELAVGDNEFSVDLSTLTSDRPRRDAAIKRDWLQSNTYPLATFKASSVAELPADAALGKEVAFKLGGDMTIRDVTQPLTWDVKATLDGSTLTGAAQTFLYMRDFGFEPPDIAGMLKVSDGVTVTVNFAADEVK